MKTLFICLLVCLAIPAWAQGKGTDAAGTGLPVEVPKSLEINDTWANVKLEFDSNVEPVWHPISMQLTLTCKDQRRTPNNVAPVAQDLPIHKTIGEFGSHSFDDKEKILTLVYYISDTEEGPAEPDKKITYKADLKTLCKAWAP